LSNSAAAQLIFSRRYASNLVAIANEMQLTLADEGKKVVPAIEPT
jgi:hypothetical protein